MDSMDTAHLPADFVYLDEVAPTIRESVRYAGPDNFTGRPVPGYPIPRVVCTQAAAVQLQKAQAYFQALGYHLVVYDGYRPQRAVVAFQKWAVTGDPQTDPHTRAAYYPTFEKTALWKEGYLAVRSSHSRGSTVDVTLIRAQDALKPLIYQERMLPTGEKILFLDDNTVDMGTSFDLFHPASHHTATALPHPENQRMREILREGMVRFGFRPFHQEWWHYTLNDEPYPNTYFDGVMERPVNRSLYTSVRSAER